VEDSSSYGPASDRLTQENAELLAELERKKRARKLQNVPTDDRKVRLRLRELGEPITKFGEGVRSPLLPLSLLLSRLGLLET
jgi:U4/U6 small nuclear ribonucleoprotein PRP4